MACAMRPPSQCSVDAYGKERGRMDVNGKDQQQAAQNQRERAVYMTLIGIFLGLFAAFSKRDETKPT